MTDRLNVLFVCTGNICRSPLAEELLRLGVAERGLSERVHVDSAGTHADHLGDQADSRMRQTARARGVRIDHRARRLGGADLDRFDLVVGMDEWHMSTLRRMANGHGVEIRKMLEFDPQAPRGDAVPDVPDPWYGGQDGFEHVYELVDRSCTVLADHIAGRLSGRPGNAL